MSLVIGYTTPDGDMYMIGDSCGFGNLVRAEYKNRKIFKAKGNVFVGAIGTFKLQNLVSVNLSMFDNIKSVRKDLLTNIVPMLNDELSDDEMSDSNMLVMFKGRLFLVQGDTSVLECAGNGRGTWKAIGAHPIAADIAMDLLVDQNPDIKPEQLLLKAMSLMASHCPAVDAPYYMVNSVDGKLRKYATATSEGVPVKGGW